MFMSSEYKPYLNNKIFKIKNSTLLYRRYMKNPNQSVNLIAKFLKTKKQIKQKNVENIRSSKIKYRKNL